MTPAPFLDAWSAVQLHLLAAVTALALGPFALYRRRRDWVHRWTGYAWVLAMGVTALSSFAISTMPLLGPFGPIHLLSLYLLYGLGQGVAHVRAGRVAAHAAQMRGLYWNALCLAGLFTLLPGRVLHEMLLAPVPMLTWPLIAVGAAGLGLLSLRRHRAARVGRRAVTDAAPDFPATP